MSCLCPAALWKLVGNGKQEHVALSLVVAFSMIMRPEFGERSTQCTFPEQNQLPTLTGKLPVHFTFSCGSNCLWLATSTTATISPRLSHTGARTDTQPGFCATVTRRPVSSTTFISGIIF